MITDITELEPIPVDLPLILKAKAMYRKWKSEVSFEQHFEDYRMNGVVVIRPDIFCMLKQIKDPLFPGQVAWFVRMAIGDLTKLMSVLPWRLPNMYLCRRNDYRLRKYDVGRLLELTKE